MSLPTAAVSVPGAGVRSWQLLGVVLLLYVLSFLALARVGVAAVLAWPFLVPALLIILPFAYALSRGLFLVGRLLESRSWLIPPVGILIGTAVD